MNSSLLNKQRIKNVDIIRGIALLGIFLTHMLFWYRAELLPNYLKNNLNGLTKKLYWLDHFFISGKFFAIFSFLFGLSFYLMQKSVNENTRDFNIRYAWRNIIMGMIGFIHNMFWGYDILCIYAPLAFILLALQKLSNRIILILGIIFALNIPGIIIYWIRITFHLIIIESATETLRIETVYQNLITHGTVLDLFKYNWNELGDKYLVQIISGRIFFTFGFILLGLYVGRKGWFENFNTSKKLVKRICIISFLGVLIFFCINHFSEGKNYWLDSRNIYKYDNSLKYGLLYFIYDSFKNCSQAFFYLSGIVLILDIKFWQKRLSFFAGIGKLALTSYLSQTFIGLTLFFNIGFGLYQKTMPITNLGLTIIFFMFQALISYLWLMKFMYGPVEWVWRMLTYCRWIPNVKRE